MRIGLVMHSHRADALAYTVRAVKYLTDRGAQVSAEDRAAARLEGVTPFSALKDAPEVILCMGGDGTILRGGQYALKWHAPLLGVNLGNMGFLAETESEDMEGALDRLLSGDYDLEERPLLSVESGEGRWLALNDVVISRGGYSRLITLTALVDGEAAGRYVADGVIVATPTGSTGYSLSAGGPVISPKVDCMVITPICAHSLQHRPTVVHGDAAIQLLLGSDAEQSAALEVDGQNKASLRCGDTVLIHRAPETLCLVRLRRGMFFQTLRDKLIEWTN